jgi:hypothetical protein
MIRKIHHVAFAHPAGSPMPRALQDALELPEVHQESGDGFVERMFRVGDGFLQLLEPTGPGTVQRFLKGARRCGCYAAQGTKEAKPRHLLRHASAFPASEKEAKMVGAILLGLVAGVVARVLMPGDVFRNMSGPASWGVSLVLGLAGALVGYVIFTLGLGIGDTDIFDWGRHTQCHHRHAHRARPGQLLPAPPPARPLTTRAVPRSPGGLCRHASGRPHARVERQTRAGGWQVIAGFGWQGSAAG